MRIRYLLLAFALSASTFASPVITSVEPNVGPVSGGTTVTIRGTGFSDTCIICSPPFADPIVSFGVLNAASVRFIDSTTLEAVTPPHEPGSVSVTVSQHDGSDPNFDTLEDGFTYLSGSYDGYDPVLFPIFTPPVFGRSGSEFRTTAKFWNKSLDRPITFIGLDTTCTLIDPPIYPGFQFTLEPRQEQAFNLWPECNPFDTAAKLFYVPKGERSLVGSLRVWEVTQQGANHGVEIPVVQRDDFSEESIALVDVPIDPKFRLTLRVYGLNRNSNHSVNVSFAGQVVQLPLLFSGDDFQPSYAIFTDFPPFPGPPFPQTINVLVEVPRGQSDVSTPIWAFITVTNNETQHITTITPQH